MKNQLTVAPQGDGTQTWTNTDAETGAIIVYQFVPASTVKLGDRVEIMREFAPGRGTTRTEPLHIITAQDVTDLSGRPGSFVRVKEL